MSVNILALNDLVGGDLEQSLDAHLRLGLRQLDIKSNWAGALIENSDATRGQQLAEAIKARDLSVHCLSTSIGNCGADADETTLKEYSAAIERTVRLVDLLQPRYVRLILPQGDDQVCDDARVIDRYRSWSAQLLSTGVGLLFENEIGGSIGRDPHLVQRFLTNLDVAAELIWDIANQWQEGRYPSLADLEVLQQRLRVIHVKGGRWDDPTSKTYHWKAQLRDSDWPVRDLLRAAMAGGIEAICLNYPHGEAPAGFQWDLQDDLAYLRELAD